MAFTRSSGRNTIMISAMEAGPVAAPSPAPRTRKRIRDPAFHAIAVSPANTSVSMRANMNIRFCPQMSPALPSRGPTTPNARSGPVITHVRVVVSECRSAAMRGRETARIVIVKPTEKSPARTVHRTHHS